ncbi:hypothetical protein MASR2M70_12820 [Bacillota bacterium]
MGKYTGNQSNEVYKTDKNKVEYHIGKKRATDFTIIQLSNIGALYGQGKFVTDYDGPKPTNDIKAQMIMGNTEKAPSIHMYRRLAISCSEWPFAEMLEEALEHIDQIVEAFLQG